MFRPLVLEVSAILAEGCISISLDDGDKWADFPISGLVDDFVKDYDERDETQVEWLITNIVEFGKALDKLKKLVTDTPELKPVRVICENKGWLMPMCWKCTHVFMERMVDGSYTIAGCAENRNIRSWEDAQTMCPHKQQ
jgi:hypothetical protein